MHTHIITCVEERKFKIAFGSRILQLQLPPFLIASLARSLTLSCARARVRSLSLSLARLLVRSLSDLVHINIRWKKVGDVMAKEVADLLRKCARVQTLDMQDNFIGCIGYAYTHT